MESSVEWYEIDGFKKRIAEIEQFLIEIAANEAGIAFNGFGFALSLPAAESAIKSLRTFNEDFSAVRRLMHRIDRSSAEELNQLEGNGKVVEEVALIELQIRMAMARTTTTNGLSAASRVFSMLPFLSKMVPSKGIFGETPISLQRTIINLGRMKSIIAMFSNYVTNRSVDDDEIFKPSNINAERVVELIDKALVEIEDSASLSKKELNRLQSYLLEAKKEALSAKPSWSKVIGALVIVAAVTSGLADAPGAAKTIKDAIEYVLGTSMAKSLRAIASLPLDSKEGDSPESIAA
jgi:uncharacterized protein (DUF1778 family)